MSDGETPCLEELGLITWCAIGTRLAKQRLVAPKRILVVDDEWDNLECVQEFLQSEFDVTAACGGAAGVDCLFNEHFDAVVLDLTMPDVDGFEVMRIVKRVMPELPVLLASAVPQLDRVAASMGAADYICKPFKFEQLLERVRALTGTAARSRAPNAGVRAG